MKQKVKFLIPVLCICPFLMANSPAPYVEPQEDYMDFNISNIEINPGQYENLFDCAFTLTNTGNGYISMYDFVCYNGFENKTDLYQQVLAPGRSFDFVSFYFGDKEIKKESLIVYAYTVDEKPSATFSNIRNIKYQNNRNIHSYSFNVDYYSYDTANNYSVIYDVNVNDTIYSFVNYRIQNNYEFQLPAQYSVEDIQISNFKTIKGRKKNTGGNVFLNALIGIGFFAIASVGLTVILFFGGLTIGLIFLIRAVVKKNKHKV